MLSANSSMQNRRERHCPGSQVFGRLGAMGKRHISIFTLQLVPLPVTHQGGAICSHPWMTPADAMMVGGRNLSESLLCIGLKCVFEPQTIW